MRIRWEEAAPAPRLSQREIAVSSASQLGGERSLRDFQHFSALAEGLWGHGTTTVQSAGRTSQGERPKAYFSQLAEWLAVRPCQSAYVTYQSIIV